MKLTDDSSPEGAPAQHETLQTETVETATAKIAAAIATINALVTSAQKRCDPKPKRSQTLPLIFGDAGSLERFKRQLGELEKGEVHVGHIDMETPFGIFVCVACYGDSVKKGEMEAALTRHLSKPKGENMRPAHRPSHSEILEGYRTLRRANTGIFRLHDGTLGTEKDAIASAAAAARAALS